MEVTFWLKQTPMIELSAQGEHVEPKWIGRKLRVVISEIVHVGSVYIRGYYCL
jgi:hypothetical protein